VLYCTRAGEHFVRKNSAVYMLKGAKEIVICNCCSQVFKLSRLFFDELCVAETTAGAGMSCAFGRAIEICVFL
jgi:hypothetical protein